LLNVFYQRWQSAGVVAPPQQSTLGPGASTEPPLIAPPPGGLTVGTIDDFEGAPPAGTAGWESYFQDNADTRLFCGAESGISHAGAAALKFEFDAAANSWATCGFYFDSIQNWSAGQGISFYLRADRAGIPFDIDVYGGDPGGRTTYIYHAQTPAGSESNWMLIEIPWAEILRADWEENPGLPINPAQITGFSFGLNIPENARLAGTLWVDDLSLLGTAAPAFTPAPLPPSPPPTEPEPASRFPCGGALILPLALIGLSSWRRMRK
jgi:hypothetical protein